MNKKREGNLLRIIGVLLNELTLQTEQSEAKIIEQIIDAHDKKSGLSKSNLEAVFSDAKKSFEQ